MAGSSTAELQLRPTGERDLAYVLAAEADPDSATFLAALAPYRSEGFVEEGLLRDALFFEGGFRSPVVMSILRPDWSR